MAGLAKAARSAGGAAGAGLVREVAIVADGAITILSRVTAEYYLLLLLGREGNLGRGRFELRKAAADLEKELV
jgi:predicted regulator of Ras-like GTPase activity (Roadblock/LC7/MglB family)